MRQLGELKCYFPNAASEELIGVKGLGNLANTLIIGSRVKEVGADQILLAADYSNLDTEFANGVSGITEHKELTAKQKGKFLGENAAKSLTLKYIGRCRADGRRRKRTFTPPAFFFEGGKGVRHNSHNNLATPRSPEPNSAPT